MTELIKMDVTLLFFVCIALFGTLIVNVETRLEGETLTVFCRVNQPISYCGRYGVESIRRLNGILSPELRSIKYHEQGLKNGECGITIPKLTKKLNEKFECRLAPQLNGDNNEVNLRGNITVVIEKASPQINVTRIKSEFPTNTSEENQTRQAVCTIEYKRPVSSILWLINIELIKSEISSFAVELAPEHPSLEHPYPSSSLLHRLRNLTYLNKRRHLTGVSHSYSLLRQWVLNFTSKPVEYFSPKPNPRLFLSINWWAVLLLIKSVIAIISYILKMRS